MKKSFLFFLLLMCTVSIYAQTEDWKQIHIGNRAFRSGRYDAAEVAYRKALLQSPNNARAYFNLGDTYMAKKNPDAAMQQFKFSYQEYGFPQYGVYQSASSFDSVS